MKNNRKNAVTLRIECLDSDTIIINRRFHTFPRASYSGGTLSENINDYMNEYFPGKVVKKVVWAK